MDKYQDQERGNLDAVQENCGMKWKLVFLHCRLGMESFLDIDLNSFEKEGTEGGNS